MFVAFSKRVRGGLRLGAGMRITKRNFLYMAFIVLMYYIAYISIVGSIWLIVGICYFCFVLPVKLIIKAVRGGDNTPEAERHKKSEDFHKANETYKANYANMPEHMKYKRPTLPDVVNGLTLKYGYDDVKLAMSDNDKTPVDFGAAVKFEAEPENKYDENAVAAYVGTSRIGYLHKGRLQDMFHDYKTSDGEVHGIIESFDEKHIFVKVGYYK